MAREPRRRVRRNLATRAMTYLTAIIESGNAQALNHAPIDWLEEEEQRAFTEIREHVHAYGNFPSRDTLARRGIMLPDTTEGFEFCRDDFFEDLRTRRVGELILSLQEGIEQNQSGNDLVSMVQGFQADYTNPETVGRDGAEALAQAVERMDPNLPLRTVRTGITAVDSELGGVKVGNLWVLAGRPGYGKTYYQLAGCVNMVREGQHVLYVSKELSDEEIEERLAILIADMSPDLGHSRQVTTRALRNMRDRVQRFIADARGRLTMATSDTIQTPGDIESLVAETNPTHVLVDGTYFLKADDHHPRDSQTEAMTKLVRNFKTVANRTGRPIGITWQQNRTRANGTEALYGTDALSQDVSLALMLKRYRQDEQMRGAWVSKNRHGRDNFEIGMSFEFKPTRLGEHAEIPQVTLDRQRRSDAVEGNAERVVQNAVRQAGAGRPAPGAEVSE